jgi:hypothetical protein
VLEGPPLSTYIPYLVETEDNKTKQRYKPLRFLNSLCIGIIFSPTQIRATGPLNTSFHLLSPHDKLCAGKVKGKVQKCRGHASQTYHSLFSYKAIKEEMALLLEYL